MELSFDPEWEQSVFNINVTMCFECHFLGDLKDQFANAHLHIAIWDNCQYQM